MNMPPPLSAWSATAGIQGTAPRSLALLGAQSAQETFTTA
jgi:hypothetical protein